MTAYDVIGGNESKRVILDTQNDQRSNLYCLHCLFMLYITTLYNYSLRRKLGVYSPENEKFSGDCRA